MKYCNHAGTSWPKPEGVAEAMHETLVADPREHAAIFARSHAAIASFFGAGASADRLLLTPSCTSALAIVIGDLPWQHGDVVVTSSLEHHALVQQLVWHRGVEHLAAPRAADTASRSTPAPARRSSARSHCRPAARRCRSPDRLRTH